MESGAGSDHPQPSSNTPTGRSRLPGSMLFQCVGPTKNSPKRTEPASDMEGGGSRWSKFLSTSKKREQPQQRQLKPNLPNSEHSNNEDVSQSQLTRRAQENPHQRTIVFPNQRNEPSLREKEQAFNHTNNSESIARDQQLGKRNMRQQGPLDVSASVRVEYYDDENDRYISEEEMTNSQQSRDPSLHPQQFMQNVDKRMQVPRDMQNNRLPNASQSNAVMLKRDQGNFHPSATGRNSDANNEFRNSPSSSKHPLPGPDKLQALGNKTRTFIPQDAVSDRNGGQKRNNSEPEARHFRGHNTGIHVENYEERSNLVCPEDLRNRNIGDNVQQHSMMQKKEQFQFKKLARPEDEQSVFGNVNSINNNDQRKRNIGEDTRKNPIQKNDQFQFKRLARPEGERPVDRDAGPIDKQEATRNTGMQRTNVANERSFLQRGHQPNPSEFWNLSKQTDNPRRQQDWPQPAPRQDPCSMRQANDLGLERPYRRVEPIKRSRAEMESASNEQESDSKHSSFRTARQQLVIDNQKKFGRDRGEPGREQSETSESAYGSSKRSLGARRGPGSKFVPPVLNRDADGEPSNGGTLMSKAGPGGKAGAEEELQDERLKGIEPRMVELITNEIMDCGAPVAWNDIAGLEFAKKTIKEIVVWPMLRPDIFTGLRGPPKGLLLFGPPGTGKTLIGKCIASQSKSTFFSISASSLTSKWVGEGEKMVRALFAVARVNQPSVIFIDEMDSLLSQRSEGEHESSRRIKTEFLVQLDGATTGSEERILVVGATNRPQELDEAARRRFVKRLYIPLPEGPARSHIVLNLLKTMSYHLSEEQLDNLVQKTDGYSGADMANLCREAALGPIRSISFEDIETISAEEVRPIEFRDFQEAFTVIRASVSSKDLDNYLEWNKNYGSAGSAGR